ncbi:MAG: hypothetical protein IIZ39_01305 [Blautia sp.]|nr:hypothetical protein [Blautia sp.]
MKKDTFGINIKEYCRRHEQTVEKALEEDRIPPDLLFLHREKIQILQHERLVHLLVTIMVVFVTLFVLSLVLLHPELGLLPAIFMLGLAVLLGFYFFHYFFLENTVQHWYWLLEQLEEKEEKDANEKKKEAERGMETR